MNIKNLVSAIVLALLTAMSASASNIDVTAARATASGFLKLHASAAPGSFRAPAATDLKLAYTEASSVVTGANTYYAFNINGGGFIIIAGEDRATQVLGYSDQGRLDFANLPDNFKALMSGYKEQIEYLQSHPEYKVSQSLNATITTSVDPLIKSMWGQEWPYCMQCPTYNGEYCVVGCVATAMSQVMHYWRYPTSSPALNAYYCYDIGQTVPSLPETSFDYSKMLLSYCHWDWDLSELIQDTYTDEQAQAVAKLARYCGQAVRMGYSPEGSGAYTSDQLSAMKTFGFNNQARDVTRDSWWGTSYSTQEWEAMIRAELDKRHPILYSANDPAAGGHAFVCDGYNTDGLFHFNFGWYGTCNGWYASTALNMTHRDGDYLRFNSGHEMLLDIVPPNYCLISTDGLDASHSLMVLGDQMEVQASNVNIMTSNPSINLIFSLVKSNGQRMSTSNAINITTNDFEQGSNLSSSLTLPTTLEAGSYGLAFHYYQQSPRMSTQIECTAGQLNVIGHLAKYNAPFAIDDVTTAIGYLLTGSHPELKIDDVTLLINALLMSE